MDSLSDAHTPDTGEAELELTPTRTDVTARLLGRHASALPLDSEHNRDEQSPPKAAESNGISELEIPGLIEHRGYVCPARNFGEQAAETDRTTPYEYLGEEMRSPNVPSNEHDGLVELSDFLEAHQDDPMARGMLDSLTFIGEKELREAAAGIAAYWKHFLDSNPDARLCAVAGLSIPAEACSCCTPVRRGMVKSDRYIIERVLEHFTDEEQDKYRGRLLLGLNHVKVDGRRTKVVLIDDWIISGQQMGHVVHQLRNVRRFYDIEINLVVATADLIENGFESNGQRTTVRSYFTAHTATGPTEPSSGNAYITGIHSSVDRNFARALQNIEQPGPGLTRIYKNHEVGGLPRTRRMKPD